jgi:uncharacterized protein YndB with AHSA1/START domain
MVSLHHSVSIQSNAATVYAAIATTKGNRGWWMADSNVDEKVGGKAEFGFDKREVVFRMSVDKLAPGASVVMSCYGGHPEWNGTTLTWTIERSGDETILRFVHGGWKSMSGNCASCNSMWGNLMFRLKRYVESGEPDPQWTE